MTPLRKATLLSTTPGCIELQLELGWRARVTIVDGHTGRFTLLPPEGFREPRTWALDPTGQYPLEGRRREGLFASDANAVATQDGEGLLLTGTDLRARIALEPFAVTWQQRDAQGQWQFCCGDRDESYAYGVSARSGMLYHWQKRDPAGDRYFGLGDKTGPINLAGRRLRTRALDALGYDAKTGDPLYKHWPFFLEHHAGSSLGNANSHDNKNLPIVLAGGGYKHGQHLAFDTKNNYPLSNLYVTMLQRLGIETGEFSTGKATMRGLEMA